VLFSLRVVVSPDIEWRPDPDGRRDLTRAEAGRRSHDCIATDVWREIFPDATRTNVETLVDIKESIESSNGHPSDAAAKQQLRAGHSAQPKIVRTIYSPALF
jgi:hypothetical protein